MELALMYTLEQGQTKICEAAERGVFVGRDTYLEFLRPISAPEGETCVVCQQNFLDHPQDVVQTLSPVANTPFTETVLQPGWPEDIIAETAVLSAAQAAQRSTEDEAYNAEVLAGSEDADDEVETEFGVAEVYYRMTSRTEAYLAEIGDCPDSATLAIV
jgi:hypothetical protein